MTPTSRALGRGVCSADVKSATKLKLTTRPATTAGSRRWMRRRSDIAGELQAVVEINTVDITIVDILSSDVRHMTRTGRRPGDSGTRDAISAAARHQFGT